MLPSKIFILVGFFKKLFVRYFLCILIFIRFQPDKYDFRLIDGHVQDFTSLANYLMQFSNESFSQAVCDFHLLLYLATNSILPMSVSTSTSIFGIFFFPFLVRRPLYNVTVHVVKCLSLFGMGVILYELIP